MKRNSLLPYVTLIALLLLGLVLLHLQSLDGLHGRLLESAFGADTEYTKGYTDAAFAKVRAGQTKQEVIDALGEPFTKSPSHISGKERWMYSRSPTSTHYRYREVQLVDGVVVEKRNHFYID
jgi:outer membrane protein assembly factor BamE (lipoprotein component of BamABCDE complex)